MQIYRVTQGDHTRWFAGEDDARAYADDRWDKHLDGVPFVEPIDALEALAVLNEFESSKKQRLGDVYV
jgi:hypothetical protein